MWEHDHIDNMFGHQMNVSNPLSHIDSICWVIDLSGQSAIHYVATSTCQTFYTVCQYIDTSEYRYVGTDMLWS